MVDRNEKAAPSLDYYRRPLEQQVQLRYDTGAKHNSTVAPTDSTYDHRSGEGSSQTFRGHIPGKASGLRYPEHINDSSEGGSSAPVVRRLYCESNGTTRSATELDRRAKHQPLPDTLNYYFSQAIVRSWSQPQLSSAFAGQNFHNTGEISFPY